MRSHESDLQQFENALWRQNQAWELAQAALAQLGNQLRFRVSSALREELEAALSPDATPHSNLLGRLGARA